MAAESILPACEHVFVVHPTVVRERALELIAEGLPDSRVAAELGVPRTTVRDWRRMPAGTFALRGTCPRCWLPARPITCDAADYSYLLGIYLGDGCISQAARAQSLRISCDPRYPGVIGEIEATLNRCFRFNKVNRVRADAGRTTVLNVYSKHLACLFPQHGPGKKHDRTIALEPWQEGHVAAAPWSLLRGLIHSDGCHFVNPTGKYRYFSYDFTNISQDLLSLFCRTCDAVGVEYRRYPRRVRIYRRDSVSLVRHHVGLKT